MHVIIRGNFSDGYTVVGPFDSFESASEYDYRHGGGGNWIASTEKPEGLHGPDDDSKAMDQIALALDGQIWDSDTTSTIAEIVRKTGRDVSDFYGDE